MGVLPTYSPIQKGRIPFCRQNRQARCANGVFLSQGKGFAQTVLQSSNIDVACWRTNFARHIPSTRPSNRKIVHRVPPSRVQIGRHCRWRKHLPTNFPKQQTHRLLPLSKQGGVVCRFFNATYSLAQRVLQLIWRTYLLQQSFAEQ